jgi:hypothetical protein
MSNTTCNNATIGIVKPDDHQLTYAEALVSPCSSCASPCCTYLPLQTFKIDNIRELDHAIYVLNFKRIVLGLSASGEWGVYYNYPCRYRTAEGLCHIHNMGEQPSICVHYNPYGCWYKRAFTGDASDEFIQIDQRRLEFIMQYIAFDESRNITQVPDWTTMLQGMASIPLDTDLDAAEPPTQDLFIEAGKDLVPGLDDDSSQGEETFSYEAIRDPCSSCQALCCKTLVFPFVVPPSAVNLDYLKFCLGFPGIELGIDDSAWSIIVRTSCRHLQDNRCSVYGKPERPLLCKYYDALRCSYKTQFGTRRPAGFLRVNFNQLDWLIECFQFDQNGAIVQIPPVEAIRNHIEERWQSGVAQPALQPR